MSTLVPLQRRLIASAVILDSAGKVLLGRKAAGVPPYPDAWRIPGGGIETGELCIDALRREICEETGIEIDDIRAARFSEDTGLRSNGEHVHYVFLDYLVRYASGTVQANDDMAELHWFHPGELQTLAAQKLLSPPTAELLRHLSLIV